MDERIEGVGDPSAPVKVVPDVDYTHAVLSAQEGFVLSRIDGVTSVDTLCLISGLGPNTTIDILRRLRSQGIIVVGDEKPVRSEVDATGGAIVGDRLARKTLAPRSNVAEAAEDDEEDVDLKPEARARIREMFARLGELNFFELLDVKTDASEKVIRRAYFKLSKLYHPDRYYTKRLGRYHQMLSEIFKQVSAAYKHLEIEEQRNAYRELVLQEQAQSALEEQIEGIEGGVPPAPSGAAGQPVEAPLRPRARTDSVGRGLRRKRLMSQFQAMGGRAPTSDGEPVVSPREEMTPEEIARRDADRARRRQRFVTGSNPAANLKKKAREFYDKGVRQFEQDQALAAAASLKLAVTYDPDEPEYEQAYRKAVDASREGTGAGLFKRARVEEEVGRLEVAGRLYMKAADVLPRPQHLLKAAEAALWMEDLIKAKEYARKAVAAAPESIDARLMLARTLAAVGMVRNARREVDAALRISPQNAEAKALLKELKRA